MDNLQAPTLKRAKSHTSDQPPSPKSGGEAPKFDHNYGESHSQVSSDFEDSQGEVSSDGGEYADLPIIIESTGHTPMEETSGTQI
mmetsp:Transcript_36913/g.56528  ORF Transcript_36913/g.56528 Transcript_36913/m.56528 type:complete len:85 (-) Transcript_36913:1012-1266(-)